MEGDLWDTATLTFNNNILPLCSYSQKEPYTLIKINIF